MDGSDTNEKMLQLYIYDHLRKNNLKSVAETFAREAGLDTSQPIFLNTPEGYLKDWFRIFWDTYFYTTGERSLAQSEDISQVPMSGSMMQTTVPNLPNSGLSEMMQHIHPLDVPHVHGDVHSTMQPSMCMRQGGCLHRRGCLSRRRPPTRATQPRHCPPTMHQYHENIPTMPRPMHQYHDNIPTMPRPMHQYHENIPTMPRPMHQYHEIGGVPPPPPSGQGRIVEGNTSTSNSHDNPE